MTCKVAILEDIDELRESLRALVHGSPGFACIGCYGSAEAALQALAREKPDILILDLELPGMSALDYLRESRSRAPEMKVLVLTQHKDPDRIFRALRAGASGYLEKPTPPARVLEALAEVRAGGAPMSAAVARLVVRAFHEQGHMERELEQLTSREDEVLRQLTQGYSTKEIADVLKISARTVTTHIQNIYGKLHIHSRAAIASKFPYQGRSGGAPPPPAG